jgi:hypothetical protein
MSVKYDHLSIPTLINYQKEHKTLNVCNSFNKPTLIIYLISFQFIGMFYDDVFTKSNNVDLV